MMHVVPGQSASLPHMTYWARVHAVAQTVSVAPLNETDSQHTSPAPQFWGPLQPIGTSPKPHVALHEYRFAVAE